METLTDSIIEFIKVRQLNIAVAALVTALYLVYQYRDVLFKGVQDECEEPRRARHISRSKSRSRSRSRSASYHDYKVHRRGRKVKRCPDCSKCSSDPRP